MNEVISWAKKANNKIMIFKVDFEKAIDSINWGFIDDIMMQMGFGTLWINWIRASLDSGFSSILVNGSPTPEFKLSKGLGQGDPLSPFLFIIAIEALHIAMLEAREKQIFQGIKLGKLLFLIYNLQTMQYFLVNGLSKTF